MTITKAAEVAFTMCAERELMDVLSDFIAGLTSPALLKIAPAIAGQVQSGALAAAVHLLPSCIRGRPADLARPQNIVIAGERSFVSELEQALLSLSFKSPLPPSSYLVSAVQVDTNAVMGHKQVQIARNIYRQPAALRSSEGSKL